MFNFTALPPLSLYIHVPWCVRKCPYCDFNSHKARDTLPEFAYVDALLADLEQELPLIWGRTIQTIFIGGGTPSLFSAEAYDRLFSGLRALLPIKADAEITMEANPGTFEAARFRDYRQLGINRLSIGIQSFNNGALERLGRIHDGMEAQKAVAIAYDAGFENVNLDLMFGLPGQTESEAVADIETAIALQPQHISYYQLTIEPNTLFYQQPPQLLMMIRLSTGRKPIRHAWPTPAICNMKYQPMRKRVNNAVTISITGNLVIIWGLALVPMARFPMPRSNRLSGVSSRNSHKLIWKPPIAVMCY